MVYWGEESDGIERVDIYDIVGCRMMGINDFRNLDPIDTARRVETDMSREWIE